MSVMNALLCLPVCLWICVIGVYDMDVKATDISVSTGLNCSDSLKRTKLKEAYLTKLDTVEVGQVTKCIFVTC